MVNLMREHVKELTSFEVLYEWKHKIEEETEERVILVRDSVTKKYYYFVFVYRILEKTVKFVSSIPSETVIEKEDGSFALPAVLQKIKPEVLPEVIPLPKVQILPEIIPLPEPQQPQVLPEVIPLPEKEAIVEEILEEVEEDDEAEVEVSETEESSTTTFVREANSELADAIFVRKWSLSFKTYSENTLLFQKGDKYWYVYVFHWFGDNTYTLEGIEETDAPAENKKGKKINPIKLRRPVKNQKGEQILSETLPELQEWRKVKNTREAVYPLVNRYIVNVRLDTTRIRYIFHEKDGVIKYVEETLLKQNLPGKNTEGQIIEEIVEEAIEEHEEDDKEDEDVTDAPEQKEQKLAILELFREKNPQATDLKVVKVWKNKNFQTFIEWTINIKTSGQSIFFFVLQDKETKELTFWGQEVKVSKKLPNPRRSVPEKDVLDAREAILKEFPETENLPAKKILLRVFPDGRERVIYVLRHQTSKVRYVTLKDT